MTKTLQTEFPLSPGLRYLNHAAVAPWPRRAAEAVTAFATENVTTGATNYPQWLNIESRLRDRLCKLLNAGSPLEIALVKNTSEALSFVAFGLDWQPGDQVVISDQEFPSNRIVWEALQRYGVDVRQVDISGPQPEQALIDAFSPRTRLLSISAVQYASGLKLDLVHLGQACRAHNVLFCVDAIQQLGALPFDVERYQCDFAMADGHKWMLGPEGLGVFYCRRTHWERLKLHEFGWHMVQHQGDYNRTDWEPAASARRFECGSPNMLGTVALEASLSLFDDIGMDEVAGQLHQRIDWLLDGLTALSGCRIHSPQERERRAGILTFSLDGVNNNDLFERLQANNVICVQRGAGIRLSPHFYTPPTAIEDTLDILASLARR